MVWNRWPILFLVSVCSIVFFHGGLWFIDRIRKSRRDYRETLLQQLRSEVRASLPDKPEPITEQSKIVQPPPTVNGNHDRSDKILEAILAGQKEGLSLQAEQVRLLRRLNGVFRGESYDEVTDDRASEIEQVNELVEKYGISRDEARARVSQGRVYTRQSLGMDGR